MHYRLQCGCVKAINITPYMLLSPSRVMVYLLSFDLATKTRHGAKYITKQYCRIPSFMANEISLNVDIAFIISSHKTNKGQNGEVKRARLIHSPARRLFWRSLQASRVLNFAMIIVPHGFHRPLPQCPLLPVGLTATGPGITSGYHCSQAVAVAVPVLPAAVAIWYRLIRCALEGANW